MFEEEKGEGHKYRTQQNEMPLPVGLCAILLLVLSLSYVRGYRMLISRGPLKQLTRGRLCSTLYMSKKKSTGEFQMKQFAKNRGRQNTATAKNPVRVARVARALRDELSDIICQGDIKAQIYPDEDLLRSTTIMHVEVSPGLETAAVHISVLGNSVEKRQVFVWLCENLGQVRYELCKRLKHMKKVPEIRFKLADTQAAADLMAMMEEISDAPLTSIELAEEDIEFEEEDESEDE